MTRPPLLQPIEQIGVVDRLPPLINKAKTAWMFGVTARTIDSLVAASRFPQFVRCGRSRRWRTAELLAWIDVGCPPMDEWRWPVSAKDKSQ